MAESKPGPLSRLLNRLRGKKSKKVEQDELKKEVEEPTSDMLRGKIDKEEPAELRENEIFDVPVDLSQTIKEKVQETTSNMLRGKKDEEEPAELREDEIFDVPVDLSQTIKTDSTKQTHGCNICMAETVFTLSLYLCYICGVYLCEKCSQKHDKSHELVKRKHEENERSEKAANLVLGMRGESKVERGEDLCGECDEVIGHVNVKHESDKYNCDITGLCGLENKRWVAVDFNNYCIKIFCSVSNTLLRYIKFGSKPRDVTEIKVEQKSTDPDSASGSKTDLSGAARDEPDKHCYLAVIFPWIKQIWFIDVNKTPAVKTKTIQMDKECYEIDFSEDKIFTVCREYVESEYRYSLYILSAEGEQLKVVQIPGLSTPYIHDLAVYKGRVYLSDNDNRKVLCINVEDGKTISELTLEGSVPEGISVDPNSGVVYVCGLYNNKVYKLSPDLREYEPLSLDTDYTEEPYMLCFINNKLYFSHRWWSSLRNVVTVVHVLT